MPNIWNNPEWPLYTYDAEEIDTHVATYKVQKTVTDIVFGSLDKESRTRLHARSLTDEMVSSLGIEDEKISYGSVYSSLCKRLDVHLEEKVKIETYAKDISRIALDATGNMQELSMERIKQWHCLLFCSQAKIKPKHVGDYRQGPVFISKGSGKYRHIIYEGIPAKRINGEMEKLISFINGENEGEPLVKSAIAALWFLCIHPFEDGNGRISRAISDYLLSKGYGETHRSYSMSALILKNRTDYYGLLHEYSSQSDSLDMTRWIVWNIEIALQAKHVAMQAFEKSMRLTQLMKNLDPSVYNSRQFSMLLKLADGSFSGKLTTDSWAKIHKCSPSAAFRDIQHLVKDGYLVQSGKSGPQTGYLLNPALLEQV